MNIRIGSIGAALLVLIATKGLQARAGDFEGTLWQQQPALSPAIASNGEDYLVVWADNLPTQTGSLKAARLNADGSIREVVVLNDTIPDDGPAIAACVGNYIVAWRKGEAILRRTVHKSGTLGPVQIVNPSWAVGRIAAAGNETGFIIAWVERVPGQSFTTIQAADFRADGGAWGQFLVNAHILNSPNLNAVRSDWPAIAASPSNFLLVWNQYGAWTNRSHRSLRGAILRPNGGTGTPRFGIAGRESDLSEQHSPSVAWNAGYYLVTWTDWRRKRANGNVLAALVAKNGGTRRLMPIQTGPNAQQRPVATAHGIGFLLSWSETDTSQITKLRGIPVFTQPFQFREGSPRPVTLWDDLGSSGYGLTASSSDRPSIGVLQLRQDSGVGSIVGIQIEERD